MALDLGEKDLGVYHKVVLLGDSGVGKTTLFYQIRDGYFRDSGGSTTQIDQFIKPFPSSGGEVQLQFVDTAGFETYHSSIPHSMMRDIRVILFVFALDDSSSFTHVKHWYEEALASVPNLQSNKIFKFMVGNKVDLSRKVNPSRISDTSLSTYGISEDHIFEVSAKEGSNINNLVQTVVECFNPTKPHISKPPPPTPAHPVRLCKCP